MEKVAFEFFGLTLLEPLSTLMNWVLAAECAFFYSRLRKSDDQFVKNWSWFFLLYSSSLFFGGFSHLLFDYMDLQGKIPGWSLAIIGVSVVEFTMIRLIDKPQKVSVLTTVVRSKLFATFVLMVIDFSFKWVMVHITGLLFFIGFISYPRWRKGETSHGYFLAGLGMLILSALINIAEFDVHPAWFNRHDLAHFLMLGMFWFFYIGAKNYPAQPSRSKLRY